MERMHHLVERLDAAKERDAEYSLAALLVRESATNILYAYIYTKKEAERLEKETEKGYAYINCANRERSTFQVSEGPEDPESEWSPKTNFTVIRTYPDGTSHDVWPPYDTKEEADARMAELEKKADEGANAPD